MAPYTTILSPPAPRLPSFQTLLIQGDYPASSPFHLCLSHLSCPDGSKSRPIIVSARNKARLTKSLVDLNDDWLINNSGRGTTAELLSRIHIFYPGTPDHWTFLFSMLRTDVPMELGSVPTNLGQPASLVVLHEPSAYFLDNDPPKSCAWNYFTMNSYMRLITSALASLRSLNTKTGPPPLAVFDSRLEELALPILPIAISRPTVVEEEEEEEEFRPGRRLDKVSLAVERYFDLIGRVEGVPQPSKPDENYANGTQFRMVLSSSQYSSFLLPSPLTWRWRQVRVEGTDGSPRTIFHWDEM